LGGKWGSLARNILTEGGPQGRPGLVEKKGKSLRKRGKKRDRERRHKEDRRNYS